MDDQDSILRAVQDTFRSGLVTVIGSGLSAASGLPSMGDLTKHLLENIDEAAFESEEAVLPIWQSIKGKLEKGAGLEAALGGANLPGPLRIAVSAQIVECIAPRERDAIVGLLGQANLPPLSRLLQLLMIKDSEAEVITTNYDRLIEISAALAQIRVDTQFYGHTLGLHDERLSREELLSPSTSRTGKKQLETVFRPHIRLSKPHGSLDWYDLEKRAVRSELPVTGERLVIAPGADKYREGYNSPFQEHLARANKAITNATGFLVVGYGFNDDHLQTQLKKKFPEVPSVLIAHTLTSNAHSYLSQNSQSIGLELNPAGGTKAYRGSTQTEFSDSLWDLEGFLTKVFEK